MLWVACAISFLGFLQKGEITVPTQSIFQAHIHHAWEDFSVDSVEKPKILRVHLKVSKCDQFQNGINIFLGRMESPMCSIAVTLSYMAVHGPAQAICVILKIAACLRRAVSSQLSKHYCNEISEKCLNLFNIYIYIYI